MITNKIAYWRSKMNEGKGISQAHLARRIAVGRSFVTKLEKGTALPSAEVMFRMARYFEQPVESVFQQVDDGNKTIPVSHFADFTSDPANPMCNSPATRRARPAARSNPRD